jgi:hypothetical protein
MDEAIELASYLVRVMYHPLGELVSHRYLASNICGNRGCSWHGIGNPAFYEDFAGRHEKKTYLINQEWEY